MRSLAPYTRATLRGNHHGKGYNFTFIPPSRVVTTNTKCLRPRRPPSLRLADILFTSQTADIPSTS